MQDSRRRAIIVATATKWLAVVAVMAAPLAISSPPALRGALLGVALVGCVLRVVDRRPSLTLAGIVIMAASAAAAAGATGGPTSAAYGAVFVVAADAAVLRGGGIGGIIGAGGTLATIASMAMQQGPLDLTIVDGYVLLLTMLTGLAFGTIHRDLPITGVVALRATNQTLDELVGLTQRTQPGLDRWAVADAVLTGLRDQAAVDGAEPSPLRGPHLLLEENGVLHGVGAPWPRTPLCLAGELPRQRRGRTFRTVARDTLPHRIGDELEGSRWYVHRLDASTGGGAVFVDARTHPAVLDRIEETLATATIALVNTARFEDLRAAATDAARTRLAHDLHDGIAQALAHVRFELELLSMQQDEEPEELRRARSAADAALHEVRRTIGQLREDLPLSAALQHHVDTVRTFAHVPVELVIEGDVEPPAATGREVFRLAQEALSNALRHSRCSSVSITLHLDGDGLFLVVADDGRGIAADAHAGVGLDAMHQRAEAIGGELRISPSPGGGTEVELDVRTELAEEVASGATVAAGAGRPNGRPRGRGLGWLARRSRRDLVDE